MRITAATVLTVSGSVLLPARPAWAAEATDITASVLAGVNVTLSGPSIINLPSGTTTYNGVFSGQGTLTIAGSGTLVLTRDSDFTLPSSEQQESVTRSGGSSSYPVISDPDRPAVIVESGATLQYGDGGSTGVIGDYPYASVGSVTLNHDNIEVEGTLDLDLTNREFNLGTITGTGLISQPRFTWNTLDLVGAIPFSGTISNGTGMNFGNVTYHLSLPSVASVRNDGSAVISARGYTLVLPENFYEDHYGDDINFHTWQSGLIVMTGVDHYVDPSLDTTSIAHGANYRGVNIGSANVQWGDGTTSHFFLPALPSNSYINAQGGSLTFDYDGPVTLDTPISGGTIHDSLGTPANASVSLSATNGNTVTFAVPMNYHGPTTIGRGATLLLGTGSSGGDSSLLTGAASDTIVDNGTLTVRNVSTPITLANVSGTGGLTQSGAATTTLGGAIGYTGPTTVSAGTLAIGPDASGIGSSSSLSLAAAGAIFSVVSAGSRHVQNVRQLSGVAGSTIELGSNTLSVSTSGSTTYSGSITGTSGGLTTTGDGTLTLTGHASTPGGTWHVQQGTLAIGSGGALEVGSLVQSPGSTLSLTPGSGATGPAGAPIQVRGVVELGGALSVASVPKMPIGGRVVLVHNSGSRPISGTFTGLPQGAHVNANGTQYAIDYTGDSGHDVVLTAVAASTTTGTDSASGSAAANPDTAGNAASSSEITLAEVVGLIGAAAVAAVGIVVFIKRRRRTLADPAASDGATPVTEPAPTPWVPPPVSGQPAERRRHRK